MDRRHFTCFKMANISLDDSAYASLNFENSDLNIDAEISLDDSAYARFNFENYDLNSDAESLPSEHEFVAQIKQNCLTSTDETEDLLLRLQKINTQAINNIVTG